MLLRALVLSATLLVGPRADEPLPGVRLSNPAPVARDEVVRFSMPWPAGRFDQVHGVRVGDDVAPCVTLLRWPDGSVALSQVHARVRLGPRESVELAVEPLDAVRPDPVAAPGAPPVRVELVDAWGRAYHAGPGVDPAAPGPDALSTPRVARSTFRGILERDPGGGAPREALFAVQLWVAQVAHPPRTELVVLVDADPRPGELVVGPARFRSVALHVDDPGLRARPRHRGELGIGAPRRAGDGGTTIPLLGPSDALYLGDRTGKAFAVDLLPAGADAAAELAVDLPILALPDLEWVRHTGAFGAHGGPAPARVTAAEPDLPWWIASDGGPFGGFDLPRDPVDAGRFGMPPSALHDLLVDGSWRALRRARLSVLQGALRPTPATEPRLPDAAADLRAGLSARAIARPHGFAPLDYEHVGVDLAFDVFWLTGDPCARRELARAGSGLLPLLRTPEFRTCRGEGACLRAGVLIARATGDQGLLDALRAHVRDVLAELVGGDDDPRRSWAIAQPPDRRALGADHPFDVPWQMGLLVHGLHALWRETGDETARRLAVVVAARMAGPCWIDGVGLAGFVSARDPQVRAFAPGDLAGLQGVAVGAFVLAGEMADSEADRSRFRARADEMVGGDRGLLDAAALPSAWVQLHLDRNARVR